jgi:hypothetical protein
LFCNCQSTDDQFVPLVSQKETARSKKALSRPSTKQFTEYSQEYIDKYFRYRDQDERRYWLDNLTGPGGGAKGNPYYAIDKDGNTPLKMAQKFGQSLVASQLRLAGASI